MSRSGDISPETKILFDEIIANLTEGERELLKEKADGTSLEAMASQFGVSVATIKRRWDALIEKAREVTAPR